MDSKTKKGVLAALFLIFYFAYFIRTSNKANTLHAEKMNYGNEKKEEEYSIIYASHGEIAMPSITPLVTIACQKDYNDRKKLYRSMSLYLKSLVLFNERMLSLIIIMDHHQDLVEEIVSYWPLTYRKRLNITVVDSWFPSEELEENYAHQTCEVERLVLGDMFPDLETALYTDLGMVFLRPVLDILHQVSHFNDQQFMGVAGETNICSSGIETCYNSGFLLMNLTRVRNYKEGWLSLLLRLKERAVKEDGDKDEYLLSVIQNEKPEIFYLLSQEWNVMIQTCKSLPKIEGFSSIRGSSQSLETFPEFGVVGDVLRDWQLGSNPENLVSLLDERARALVANESVDMKCPRLKYVQWVTHYPKDSFYHNFSSSMRDENS